jgi:hypothetical protein
MRSRANSGPHFHLAGLPRFTCKQKEKRRGWDSNPRDDLTPPTRFPISKGHLTNFVHGVPICPIASVWSALLRPLSRCSYTLASIAYAPVLARLQYGCSTAWDRMHPSVRGGSALYKVRHASQVQTASSWRFVSYVQSQGCTLPV